MNRREMLKFRRMQDHVARLGVIVCTDADVGHVVD